MICLDRGGKGVFFSQYYEHHKKRRKACESGLWLSAKLASLRSAFIGRAGRHSMQPAARKFSSWNNDRGRLAFPSGHLLAALHNNKNLRLASIYATYSCQCLFQKQFHRPQNITNVNLFSLEQPSNKTSPSTTGNFKIFFLTETL